MTEPASTYTGENRPEDAIPRDAERIRHPQQHLDIGMPDGIVAGFIGFGLGVITALAFRQVSDDDRRHRNYPRPRR